MGGQVGTRYLREQGGQVGGQVGKVGVRSRSLYALFSVPRTPTLPTCSFPFFIPCFVPSWNSPMFYLRVAVLCNCSCACGVGRVA